MATFPCPKVDQDIALCKEIIARRATRADGRTLQSFFSTYLPQKTIQSNWKVSVSFPGVRQAKAQEPKTANVEQLFAVCRKRDA